MNRRGKPAGRGLAADVPTWGVAEALDLVEIPAPDPVQASLVNGLNSYLRVYRLGECSVIVTRELGEYHLSISHPRRDPTWGEVARAWYAAVPGAATRTGALVLPPLSAYVNRDPRCFQVNEIADREEEPE